jgi:excisionase family DNA binding protein
MGALQKNRSNPVQLNSKTRLLTEDEAAAQIGCAVQTLRIWRVRKKNLPYVKLGRMVRYQQADIDAYIAASVRSVKVA